MKIRKVIQNTETGLYLSEIVIIGRNRALRPFAWCAYPKNAIQFENEEEAQATIVFIGAVIDWELEEQLQIVEVESKEIAKW